MQPEPSSAMGPSSTAKKPEEWAAKLGTPDWMFAGASVANHWDRDQSLVLTEKAYTAAIEVAANIGVK